MLEIRLATPSAPEPGTDGDPADADAAATVVGLLAGQRPLLRAYLRMQAGAGADLDDLEQEICIALWREAAAFDHGRSFTAWMLGFARIHVLRWRERKARDRRVIALDLAVHDHLVAVGEEIAREDVQAEALDACLARLDAASVQLLRWRYGEDRPLADIARHLRLSIATASRRLARLVQVLDACLRRPEDAALRGSP